MAKNKLKEWGNYIMMNNLIFNQRKYEATEAIFKKYADDLPPHVKEEFEKTINNIESQKQDLFLSYYCQKYHDTGKRDF